MLAAVSADARAQQQPVAGATHHGYLTGDGISWTTHVLIAREQVKNDDRTELPLALPLPKEVELARISVDGAEVVRNSRGEITALAIPGEAWPLVLRSQGSCFQGEAVDRLTIESRHPIPANGGTVRLAPPIFAGDGVQRISLHSEAGMVFEPTAELGIEHYLTCWSAPAIDERERDCLDELSLAPKGRIREHAIYFRPYGKFEEVGGMTGALKAAPSRTFRVVAGTFGVFAVLLGALSIAYVRVARRAKTEREEAVLESELRNLGRS
jgi:hypothetical protein